MKKRIVGIDVARAIAVIGMIIVNFKVVLGDKGAHWLQAVTSIFDGKAAATFVVLAGVGIALMTKSAQESGNILRLKESRKSIFKRAALLFIVGLSYMPIWPADILHFYGVYMLITALLLFQSKRVILRLALLFIFIYPLFLVFWNYETGWDFTTLDYYGFWTPDGFFRNLFFNGFHPVIPWTSFMLFGYWFGQQDLYDSQFVKKAFWWSLSVFFFIQASSYLGLSFLSEASSTVKSEWSGLLGTYPMPPLPLYMFSGTSIAFTIISACILIAKKWEGNILIDALTKTGQLALSFYVAHVLLGMGIIEIVNPDMLGKYPLVFSLTYALLFSLGCILFAVLWRKHKKSGPLEWLMRKATH